MTHALAIIPARGGSKGAPRKNLWSLEGKPLVRWSIEAALAAELVRGVVVSTDDEEIAAVSRAAGAEVVIRPDRISTDIASSEDALIHVLGTLEDPPDLTVFMQCTTPLTRAEDVDACIRRLLESGADSAFTAVESHRFIWRDRDAAAGVNHDAGERRRRQDVETEYCENGAVYVMRTEGLMRSRHRFFGRTVVSEMSAGRSWEIDSRADLRIVRGLASIACGPPAGNVAAVVFGDREVVADLEGIERLRAAGIRLAVMSAGAEAVVRDIGDESGLDRSPPPAAGRIERFTAWCEGHEVSLDQTVFLGRGEDDLDCLAAAGVGVVRADAPESTRLVADLVLDAEDDAGVLLELCDRILEGRAGDD